MRSDSTSSKCCRFCSKYFFFPLKKNSNHKCGCIYATALSDLTTRATWIWDVSPWPHTTLWATEWIWIQLKPTTWGSGRVVINVLSSETRPRTAGCAVVGGWGSAAASSRRVTGSKPYPHRSFLQSGVDICSSRCPKMYLWRYIFHQPTSSHTQT